MTKRQKGHSFSYFLTSLKNKKTLKKGYWQGHWNFYLEQQQKFIFHILTLFRKRCRNNLFSFTILIFSKAGICSPPREMNRYMTWRNIKRKPPLENVSFWPNPDKDMVMSRTDIIELKPFFEKCIYFEEIQSSLIFLQSSK